MECEIALLGGIDEALLADAVVHPPEAHGHHAGVVLVERLQPGVDIRIVGHDEIGKVQPSAAELIVEGASIFNDLLPHALHLIWVLVGFHNEEVRALEQQMFRRMHLLLALLVAVLFEIAYRYTLSQLGWYGDGVWLGIAVTVCVEIHAVVVPFLRGFLDSRVAAYTDDLTCHKLIAAEPVVVQPKLLLGSYAVEQPAQPNHFDGIAEL